MFITRLSLTLFLFIAFIRQSEGGCSSSSQCTDGRVCIWGSCKYCSNDIECQFGTGWTRNYCMTVSGKKQCVACKDNTQCTSASKSLCVTGTCSPCVADPDCSKISGKKACQAGVCVQCNKDPDCNAKTCDLVTFQCQGAGCTSSSQCSGDTPVCSGGVCKRCSAGPSICTNSGLFCTADGSCEACSDTQGCSTPALSYCDASFACVVCQQDSDCSKFSSKKKCSATGCVQCLTSADCGPGKTCTSNACQTTPVVLAVDIATTSSPYVYLITFPSELVTGALVEQGIVITLANVDPLVYSYSLHQVSTTQYQVVFTITQTVLPTTIKLTYTYYSATGNDLNPQPTWQDQTTTKKMLYVTQQQQQMGETMGEVGQAAAAAAAATSGAILILGGNPAIMWALINLIQNFYYLIFVNVNYPPNVQFFLDIFTIAGFNFIPNPIQVVRPDIDEIILPVPQRFAEYDIHGLFLDNAGNMLLIWGGVFVIYGFSLVAKKYFSRISKLISLFSNKMVTWFEWSGVFRALITSYNEIIQAAFLQMRVLTFEDGVYASSSVTAILFSIYALAFPVLLYLIIRKVSKNKLRLTMKYGTLVEEYDLKGNYAIYLTPILLLKIFCIMLSLVFLHDYPYIEIFILTALSAGTIVLLWRMKPYKTLAANYTNIACEVLFFFVHIIICVLIHDDHTTKFSESEREIVGWTLIGTCGTIVCINLGVTVAEQVKVVREGWALFKKVLQKKDKKKQAKVQPVKPVPMPLEDSSLKNIFESSFDVNPASTSKLAETRFAPRPLEDSSFHDSSFHNLVENRTNRVRPLVYDPVPKEIQGSVVFYGNSTPLES